MKIVYCRKFYPAFAGQNKRNPKVTLGTQTLFQNEEWNGVWSLSSLRGQIGQCYVCGTEGGARYCEIPSPIPFPTHHFPELAHTLPLPRVF